MYSSQLASSQWLQQSKPICKKFLEWEFMVANKNQQSSANKATDSSEPNIRINQNLIFHRAVNNWRNRDQRKMNLNFFYNDECHCLPIRLAYGINFSLQSSIFTWLFSFFFTFWKRFTYCYWHIWCMNW